MTTTLGGPPRCFICNHRKLRYKSNHDGYVTITCKNCGHSWIEEDDKDVPLLYNQMPTARDE